MLFLELFLNILEYLLESFCFKYILEMSSNVFGLGFVDFFFVFVCFLIQLFLPLCFDFLFHLLQILVFPYIRCTHFVLILFHLFQLFN